MAKFNKNVRNSKKTENLAGGEAFDINPELKLASQMLTSFVSDQYYRSEDQSISDLKENIKGLGDKKFAAQAAIYARTEFGMRSISHLVAAEIAKEIKGKEWTKRFFDKVIFRPDDMAEILSLIGKPIPNSVKKGFKQVLESGRFTEYHLAKYKGGRKNWSLWDIVNLTHPKPSAAIKKLMTDTLPPPETWEVEKTKIGQKAESEEEAAENYKEMWAKLIKERKLGYFALLRNLRKIIKEADEETIDLALEMLADEKLIKSPKNLVLPFRYITAKRALEEENFDQMPEVYRAINKALSYSVDNIPVFDGKTLVVVDNSGSMTCGVSSSSPISNWKMQVIDIASLFAALIIKSQKSDLMVFSNNAKYVSVNPDDSITTLQDIIRSGMSPAGTNFHSIFETANKAYDRIIILSDMQGWMGYTAPTETFKKYKTEYKTTPYIYSIDLTGYGTSMFPERSIFCLSGFSEKIFDTMELLEADREALVNTIKKVEI